MEKEYSLNNEWKHCPFLTNKLGFVILNQLFRSAKNLPKFLPLTNL